MHCYIANRSLVERCAPSIVSEMHVPPARVPPPPHNALRPSVSLASLSRPTVSLHLSVGVEADSCLTSTNNAESNVTYVGHVFHTSMIQLLPGAADHATL